MSGRLALPEEDAYGGDQGWPAKLIGGKVGTKLRKGKEIIGIAYGYSDDAPS